MTRLMQFVGSNLTGSMFFGGYSNSVTDLTALLNILYLMLFFILYKWCFQTSGFWKLYRAIKQIFCLLKTLWIFQVGVCVIIYAFFNSLNSVILGKLFGKRGRIPLLIFGVLYDVTLYSVLLLWQPNKGSEWAVYLFFGALGISNSICQVVSASKFMLKNN